VRTAVRPHRIVLAGILLGSVWLAINDLAAEGWANLYYAATVRSMLTSPSNFFFAAFDPGGFISVDKPPVGYWIQAVSAGVFGFHGVALLLPEALATVASVAVL